MKFNLAEHRRIYVSTGPYKSLTEAQLETLRDGNTSSGGIAISSETMSIECDLGARYRLDEVVYYRDSATTENIAIFGKQGEGAEFIWVEIPHASDTNSVRADLSTLQDRYEFIRVIHTVTAGSATAYELQVFNDEDFVQFGEAGVATVYSVDSGTSNLVPERISIYNPDNFEHRFYCLLDAEDVDSQVLATAPTSSGVFELLHGRGISMPEDVPWSSGHFVNTDEIGIQVGLVSGTVGYYYTPVIDISSLEGRRFFWTSSSSENGEIDSTSSVDSVPTVEVRFSNETPTDVGWTSGQLSNDSNWDIDTGSLEFSPYDNNHILNPQYFNYFQAKVEFLSTVSGVTPFLDSIGIEEAISVIIPPKSSADIFVKSESGEHIPGRKSNLIVWYFESNNEQQ